MTTAAVIRTDTDTDGTLIMRMDGEVQKTVSNFLFVFKALLASVRGTKKDLVACWSLGWFKPLYWLTVASFVVLYSSLQLTCHFLYRSSMLCY